MFWQDLTLVQKGNKMSEKKANRKFIGKVKNIDTKYGVMQKIYMDNLNSVNQDGTPNKYYKGCLVFVTPEGEQYLVKQLSLHVPKDGMKPNEAERGFSCHVTLNLDDDYEVSKIGE